MAHKKLKYWFDKDLAILLSEKIREHCESFTAQGFIREVAGGTKNLELKDRVELIADQLRVNYAECFHFSINIQGLYENLFLYLEFIINRFQQYPRRVGTAHNELSELADLVGNAHPTRMNICNVGVNLNDFTDISDDFLSVSQH